MSEHPIQKLMNETMEKIKSLVDVNTIIGKPIEACGTTIIPVSKVTFGFGTGGTDFQSRNSKENAPVCFGGGGGAGVTVSPICFLVINSNGDANILPLNAQAESTVDRLVEMIPSAINKFSSFMDNKNTDNKNSEKSEDCEKDIEKTQI